MKRRNSSTWQPARRNKKIGTEDSGFKSRNKFDIPGSWHDSRVFYEKLKDPVSISHSIGDYEFRLFVEPTLPNFKYFITPGDIIQILEHIPEEHRDDINTFVLRQSTRKDRIFTPTWGRFLYWAEYQREYGPTIILEAQPLNLTSLWNRKLSPPGQQELERLKSDGHIVTSDKRSHYIQSTPAAIRNTQLFRTLPHEVGHYVDYLEKVIIPSEENHEQEGGLNELYHARPSREKEDYANAYAEKFVKKLKDNNLFPFSPCVFRKGSFGDIDPEWFYFSEVNI